MHIRKNLRIHFRFCFSFIYTAKKKKCSHTQIRQQNEELGGKEGGMLRTFDFFCARLLATIGMRISLWNWDFILCPFIASTITLEIKCVCERKKSRLIADWGNVECESEEKKIAYYAHISKTHT